jgi:hypothetical protein
MWADAVSGAKASRTAAATQIPILFMVYLSVVGCLLFRVPVIPILGPGADIAHRKTVRTSPRLPPREYRDPSAEASNAPPDRPP